MKKDHISKILKMEALSNIQKKIDALKNYAKNGIPYLTDNSGNPIHDSVSGKRSLCYYPASFSQFARWATSEPLDVDSVKRSEEEGSLSFSTHSHDTLRNYPKLKNEVDSLLKAVKKKAATQLAYENGEHINAIKSDRDQWKAIAESEGLSLLQYMDRAMQAEKRVIELERALNSAREMYVDMDNERKKEIAELKRQLSEVSRFKPIKSSKELPND